MSAIGSPDRAHACVPLLRGVPLKELALAFLRLGTTAFGGPTAHIAMMEEEFVRRRQWLTPDEFLDLVGLAGLVPGPSSTEVAILVGYRRAGWRGLLLAGTCFILPAAIIVTSLAWMYVHLGRLPAAGGVLMGIKPVIVAVVAQALVAFGRTAIKTKGLLAIGLLAAGADLLDAPPLGILVAAGVLSLLRRVAQRSEAPRMLLGPVALAAPAMLASPPGLAKLFFVFLKIGAVVFGSGYVLLAFLRADLVEHPHWLDESQLIDAVAVGQFTPGPVFTTATFIGYLLAGIPGAAVATAGVFLPSFVLVALSGPFIPRIRRSPAASAVLEGVVVASFALMAVVAVRLARAAVVDVPTLFEAVVSALVLFRWRVNSAWLVLAGGVTGAIVYALR
ncbi:MAG TPA: chromate efflux transporter [Polyangiaceae bacterium]|nr:chromate efflux transporter [Polyangiaceae bacterium]